MTSQLDERIRDLMRQVVEESPPPPSQPLGMPDHYQGNRWRHRWAAAVIAAAVVIVVIGVTPWLLTGTERQPQEPVPTTAAPPTTVFIATQLAPDELPIFPREAVPPFVGNLESDTGAALAMMTIRFAGAGLGIHVTLTSDNQSVLQPIPFGELVEGGEGSYLVFDGTAGEIHLLRDGIVERWEPSSTALSRLDWRDEQLGLGRVCELVGHTAVGLDQVAGRQTHVLECSGMDQNFTAWVDTETGLVLRVANSPDVVDPLVSNYEFVSLSFSGPTDGSAPGPFHVAPRPTVDSCEPSCGPPLGAGEDPRYQCIEDGALVECDLEGYLQQMGRDMGLTGHPAPALAGSLLDGTPFSLTELHGQTVLLHFWYPTIRFLEYETRGVDFGSTRESLEAEAWAAEAFGPQVVVVSVAPGDPDLVKAIVGEHHPDVHILIPADYTIDPNCDCPEVWNFPFQPGNNWILVGLDGTVLGGFYQYNPTIAALDILMKAGDS